MASVGSIVGGAFGLIRSRPGAVALWAVTYFVGTILIGILVFAAGMPLLVQAQPGDVPQIAFGTRITVQLLTLALATIVFNGVFRAALRPWERGFGSMRLGMDEVRVFALELMVMVVAFIGAMLFGLLFLFAASFIGMISGGSPGTAMALNIVLALACVALFVWLAVRLSLMSPLTLYRRKITVDGAWELTRGRFWTLFGAFLLVGVIVFATMIALIWPYFGGFILEIVRGGGDLQKVALAEANLRAHVMGMPALVHVLFFVLCLVVAGIMVVLGAAVRASATRELLIERGEALESEEEFYGDEPY